MKLYTFKFKKFGKKWLTTVLVDDDTDIRQAFPHAEELTERRFVDARRETINKRRKRVEVQ